jgi:hypothetical protein
MFAAQHTPVVGASAGRAVSVTKCACINNYNNYIYNNDVVHNRSRVKLEITTRKKLFSITLAN